MAVVNPLLILAVVMLGLLFAVTLGMLAGRNWYDYEPVLRQDGPGIFEELLSSPIAWMLGFFVGTALLAGSVGAWLVAPEGLQGTIAGAAAAVIAVLIAIMVFTGAWDAVKSRGRSNSEAVGIGAILVGLLFVAGIAAQLVMG